MGRDVIPCDFFAKIDFFYFIRLVRVFFARKSWGSNFRSPRAQFGLQFSKLSIEPIDQQRVTQHNIDLIICQDSTVNFRRVKGAVFTFNTFFIKLLENLFWGSSSHIKAQKFTIYQACLILLSNIFLFPRFL